MLAAAEPGPQVSPLTRGKGLRKCGLQMVSDAILGQSGKEEQPRATELDTPPPPRAPRSNTAETKSIRVSSGDGEEEVTGIPTGKRRRDGASASLTSRLSR